MVVCCGSPSRRMQVLHHISRENVPVLINSSLSDFMFYPLDLEPWGPSSDTLSWHPPAHLRGLQILQGLSSWHWPGGQKRKRRLILGVECLVGRDRRGRRDRSWVCAVLQAEVPAECLPARGRCEPSPGEAYSGASESSGVLGIQGPVYQGIIPS